MRPTPHDRIRRATLFAAGLLGATAAFAEPGSLTKSPFGAGQQTLQEQAARAVRARLISESTTLAPGRTNWVALTFDIDPGWHLYWHNAGDSGMPISFKFTAPPGVQIGEAQWPTPARHITAGIILDYIYEKSVTILFPIEIDSTVSGPVTVSAAVEWLVCREACVPGGTTATASFDVGTGSARGPEAVRIDEARRRIPVPHDPHDRGKLNARFSGSTLNIEVRGASGLVFYPYASDEALPVNAIEQGESNGDRLSIDFTPEVAGAERVKGVVEVRRAGGVSEFWLVTVDPRSGD